MIGAVDWRPREDVDHGGGFGFALETVAGTVAGRLGYMHGDSAEFAVVEFGEELSEDDEAAALRECDPLEEIVDGLLALNEILKFGFEDFLAAEALEGDCEEVAHGGCGLVARDLIVSVGLAGIG